MTLGGFFPLEFRNGISLHPNAINLNSGRNALRFALEATKPERLYLPAFTCGSVVKAVEASGTQYVFYHVNSRLEVDEPPNLGREEMFLYINYFGLKSQFVAHLFALYRQGLIVDNSMSLFDPPLREATTIYSPRKFVGVPDGGYLFGPNYVETTIPKPEKLPVDSITPLVRRHDSPKDWENYQSFRRSQDAFVNLPIAGMSEITARILGALDYESIARTRQRNFWALHSELGATNEFSISLDALRDSVPMVYPYKTPNSVAIRSELINREIFVATYWKKALLNASPVERELIESVIPLPIDQRMDLEDVLHLVNQIRDLEH